MHIDEVRQMVQLVEESDIDELEVWKWWGRIKIKKSPSAAGMAPGIPAAFAPIAPPVESLAQTVPVSSDTSEGKTEEEGFIPIDSPMVGTFYRAAAPDAEAFVKVGDRVEPGQTVCIIEAMKLMNEIQTEVGGVVAKILVDNQSPVEFGEPLFLIKQD
jgi:acetyl-CoA carboxylase biotin carboxyl carrier protein